MPKAPGESPESGGSADSVREHRIQRSDERVIDNSVADVARVDDRLIDLLERGAA